MIKHGSCDTKYITIFGRCFIWQDGVYIGWHRT